MIRKAHTADIPFLAQAIREAEKGGTDILSYCRIFGITEVEFDILLRNMLDEDLEGQEICISGFLVAEEDGQPVACVCGWIEAESGMTSGMLKGSLLMQYLGAEKIRFAETARQVIQPLSLERTPGALQLESIYTLPAYRGRGLAQALIKEHETLYPSAEYAQIMVSGHNQVALQAYAKAGYTIRQEISSGNPEISRYLPHHTKILLEKKLHP